jgi:Ca2+-binding RTX toxin-like protein
MTKTGRISTGWDGNIKTQLYVTGSIGAFGATNGEDNVEVTQEPNGSGPPKFKFRLTTDDPTGVDVWDAKFSTQLEDRSPDCSYAPTEVVCEPDSKSVTLVVAVLGSNDVIELDEMSQDTNPILIGGHGNDSLTGGVDTDDFIVDGSGNDQLWGKGKDDGLVNTDGTDEVRGENGSDLVLSDGVCQGDMLYGGNGTDSASWAKIQVLSAEDGVFAEIDSEKVGRKSGGSMSCTGTIPQNLNDFEDLEGSNGADILRGDNWTNQLIGRAGADKLRSLKSTDRILANSADDDEVLCGEPVVPGSDPRADVAKVDHRPDHDDATSGCEKETEADAIFESTDPGP